MGDPLISHSNYQECLSDVEFEPKMNLVRDLAWDYQHFQHNLDIHDSHLQWWRKTPGVNCRSSISYRQASQHLRLKYIIIIWLQSRHPQSSSILCNLGQTGIQAETNVISSQFQYN